MSTSSKFDAPSASASLLSALQARNARDLAFSQIVRDYAAVSTLALEAQTRTAQLEKEAHELRAEAAETSDALASLRADAARGIRAAEAERELAEARKEASEAFKSNSRLAEEALEASRALSLAREASEAQAKSLEDAAREIEALRSEAERLTEEARAAKAAAAASEEELRERLTAKEEAVSRSLELEREVSDLSKRLVEMRSAEVERLNATNAQCEEMLRAARSVARGAAASAAARGAATAASAAAVASGLFDRIGIRSTGRRDKAARAAAASERGASVDAAADGLEDVAVAPSLPPPPPPSLLPDALAACLPPHAGGAFAAAFDRSGRALATAGADRVIRLWETSSSLSSAAPSSSSASPASPASPKVGCVGSLHGMLDTVTCLSFACDGRSLLAGGEDRALRLWEVNVGGFSSPATPSSTTASALGSGRVRHALTGHSARVTCCSTSPLDPRVALSASSDRCVKVWDLSRGFCVQTLVCNSACHAARLTAGGLALTGHFDGSLRAWDERSGRCVQVVEKLHGAQVTSVDVGVDGATVLTCGRDSLLRVTDARSMEIKKTGDGAPCPAMGDPEFHVTSVWCAASLGPDSRHAAAASGDGSGLFVWETSTGRRVRRLGAPGAGGLAAAWSPQGSPLVCCDRGGGVSLWVPGDEAPRK